MNQTTARPDFAVIQRWVAERAELIGKVTDLGFEVSAREKGYAVHVAGRQVAVFDIDDLGAFRWGWVEHRTGDGRTDYDHLTSWLAALASRPSNRKAASA